MDFNKSDPSNRFLSDDEKLLILLVAACLFLITLIATICFVAPCCWLNRLLSRVMLSNKNEGPKSPVKPGKQHQIMLESKNFQLTVQPQFIDKHSLVLANTGAKASSPIVNGTDPVQMNELNKKEINHKLINLYNPETEQELKIQKKILKEIFKRKEWNDNPFTVNHKELVDYDYYTSRTLNAKSKISLLTEEDSHGESNSEILMSVMVEPCNEEEKFEVNWPNSTVETTVGSNSMDSGMESNGEKIDQRFCLLLNVPEIRNLPPKPVGPEFNVFLTVTGQPNSSHFRKSSRKLNHKLNDCIQFRSDTIKVRGDRPKLSAQYRSAPVERHVIKDSRLKVRVMHETKYANDRCLGELNLNLKQFLNDSQSMEGLLISGLKQGSAISEPPVKCYKLNPPKDVKGDLLFGTCYLPTSKRITFIIVKASIYSQIGADKNFYVRILMFFNNKVIKKKKSSSNIKLVWPENETITFDLSNFDAERDQLAFLVVLSSTNQQICKTLSSPSSPDSPTDCAPFTPRITDNHSSKNDRHIGHFLIGNEFWSELQANPRKQIIRLARLH